MAAIEMFNPEFLATENNDSNDENDLVQYLQKPVSYTHLTLPTTVRV